ncbi:SAF domain-containing protein [Streptomyces violascens]|uniref:SAF domain-containing protein n=1 Tax=Streptomyces violascens TaxID=67381 RepID=UPI00367DB9A8
MDTTTPPVPAPRVVPQPDLAISTGTKKRGRKWSPFVLFVLVALVGALIGAVTITQAGERVNVLAVARDVPAGHALTDADLTVASFAEDPGLSPVRASERSSVVGRRATVDLRRGGLLTLAQLTAGKSLGDDKQLVGVEVRRSQAPRDALVAGDQVLAVILPSDGAQGPNPPKGAPGSGSGGEAASITATVVSVGQPDASGSYTVNLAVDSTQGAVLAIKAAAKQVALVRNPRS